jgi:hypothetical protein
MFYKIIFNASVENNFIKHNIIMFFKNILYFYKNKNASVFIFIKV